MTDIDFDELDKAVNNLMGSVGKSKDDEPQPKTLNINTTLQPDEKPTYKKIDEAAQKIGNETFVTDGERTVLEDLDSINATNAMDSLISTPVEKVIPPQAPPVSSPSAPRPAATGRFMDVVHPSSDMRTAAPSTPSVPVRPDKPATPAVTPAPVEAPVAVDALSAPLTPFLPDANAKVEKRPLGGSSDGDDTVSLSTLETTSINSDRNRDDSKEDQDQLAPDPTKIDAKVSSQERALQAIESMEVTGVKEEVTENVSVDESIRAVESGDTGELRAGHAQSAPAAEGSAQPNQDGSIYDVKNYHQPLEHPAKHKSGWGTVLIIILIVIICIAAAAGAYFLLVKP